MSTMINGTTGISKVQDGSIHEVDINADVARLGVGQTWQAAEPTNTGALFTDGTPKYRVLGTTYTNNTGKPISVSVYYGSSTAGQTNIEMNGVVLIANISAANGWGTIGAIVPNGTTYKVVGVATTIGVWAELR